jgi:hypothetical protein
MRVHPGGRDLRAAGVGMFLEKNEDFAGQPLPLSAR